MHHILRTSALAALLAMSAVTAHAAALPVIDFNDATGASTTPVSYTGPTSGQTAGIVFGNAWAWNLAMNSTASSPPTDDASTDGAYLANRADGGSPLNDITISLASGAFDGQYFKTLTLRLFSSAAVSAKAGNQVITPASTGSFTGEWDTSPVTFDLSALGSVRSFSLSAASGVFGIDNLDFTLSATTVPPGGNAPEPASFALVGLALLAAGTATRRTRR